MQAIDEEVPWKQTEIFVYGKPFMQPRLICYMADDCAKNYSYSHTKMVAEPWHPQVLALKVCFAMVML